MTRLTAGIPRKQLLIAIVASTTLFLSAMSISFAEPADADWVCSESGFKPWEHTDHWFLWVDDKEHRYISGHTHTNGEHHHIWRTYSDYGFTYLGETHDNCGV